MNSEMWAGVNPKTRKLPFCLEYTAQCRKAKKAHNLLKIQTNQVQRWRWPSKPSITLDISPPCHTHMHSQDTSWRAQVKWRCVKTDWEISRRFYSKQAKRQGEWVYSKEDPCSGLAVYNQTMGVHRPSPRGTFFCTMKKFHFLDLLCFQTYMHLLSSTVSSKNPRHPLYLQSCRSCVFVLTFIKSILTNLKSLSAQTIPDFPSATFVIFLSLCHVPCASVFHC